MQPTIAPSRQPINGPSESPNSIPSASPTIRPSLQPTTHEHFIGDYKISARNLSHGNWLLCDGSFIDSTNYPELFGVIGYSFGSFSGYPLLFQLPNVTDDVVGIAGNLNMIGSVVGREEVTLTEDNLPSHWHYIAQWSNCNGEYSADTHYYLADGCTDSTWINTADNHYLFHPNDNPPNRYRSGSVGNGESVNIMQPTVFVGNLFIYAG